MANEYIARDPRTGKVIQTRQKSIEVDIRSLQPIDGAWQRIPVYEILKLAAGDVEYIQLSLTNGGGFVTRVDGIKALSRVYENLIPKAHEILLNALDDDLVEIRIAGLEVMPSFSLKLHTDLMIYLSDRLQDGDDEVELVAMQTLQKMSPVFPSGCEDILRRELRHTDKIHRKNAFDALKVTSVAWPEAGCLHLDELIREEDVDLRRRGSKILRNIAAKGGSTGWDLIGWSLDDEDVQVRRNASQCLVTLANSEPRIALILVENALNEDDTVIRNSVIRAMKKLDMQSPRVTDMILRGARSRNLELRKACISQLSIILTGDRLTESAAELLRQETNPELKKRLAALSIDLALDGTETEKNSFLAPVEKVDDEMGDEFTLPIRPDKPKGEHDKQKASRPNPEDLR
ncbi:MAG: hypothetical protein NLN66_04120 [Candidatus Thalassarchaeaceae archaeon]|nr:hypothetical protein [Candidatus Thalassarchaeaceae archaeon]